MLVKRKPRKHPKYLAEGLALDTHSWYATSLPTLPLHPCSHCSAPSLHACTSLQPQTHRPSPTEGCRDPVRVSCASPYVVTNPLPEWVVRRRQGKSGEGPPTCYPLYSPHCRESIKAPRGHPLDTQTRMPTRTPRLAYCSRVRVPP